MISLFKLFNTKSYQWNLINKLSTIILSEQEIKEYHNDNRLESNFNYPENSITVNSQILPYPFKSYNLAPYFNYSDSLKNLIKIGVDISILEKNSDVANFLLKMDYTTLLHRILFFNDNFDLKDQLGKMITKCPELLTEFEKNINVRIYYFRSKLFSDENISSMIIKTPKLLTTPIKKMDENIGFVQTLFNLDGKETRNLISRLPKIIFHSKFSLQENLLNFDRFLGYKRDEIKSILLFDPRILIAGKYAVQQRFVYLHNTMGLSHENILNWPTILRTRVSTIKPRHEFLVSINKNQYNHKLANFVTLKALAIGDDIKFCSEVAKISIEMYNDFLKTL